MFGGPHIPFGAHLLTILGGIAWVGLMLTAVAVVAIVVALLVRFLLAGTTAAKLYIANNSAAPASPSAPAEPPLPSTHPAPVDPTPPDVATGTAKPKKK